jgi:HNH endonuclease
MPKILDSDRPCIEKRLKKGESLRSIAASFNVSYQCLQQYRRKWGSPKLKIGRSGKNHPGWKGGSFIASNGYKMVLSERDANGNRYYPEHVLIGEQKLGRKIKRNEVIHHVDLIKTNNSPSNLFPCTRSKHRLLHRQLERIAADFYRRGLIKFKDGEYVVA